MSVEPRDILGRLQLFHRGQDKAISAHALSEHFGVRERAVREMIHELRRQRQPICSTHDSGYWYPVSREDAAAGEKYIKQMFRPLKEANNGFFAGLDDLFGSQMELTELEEAV